VFGHIGRPFEAGSKCGSHPVDVFKFRVSAVGAATTRKEYAAQLIMHSYTDLVTPYITSRYFVKQVPVIRANPIRIDVLAGGHMMFQARWPQTLKEAAAELYGLTQ
jgi:hypothetical protein